MPCLKVFLTPAESCILRWLGYITINTIQAELKVERGDILISGDQKQAIVADKKRVKQYSIGHISRNNHPLIG